MGANEWSDAKEASDFEVLMSEKQIDAVEKNREIPHSHSEQCSVYISCMMSYSWQ